MVKGILKPGDKIEVVSRLGLSSGEKSSFSLVQDILDNRTFLITLPMSEGHPVILEASQKVRICFYRNEGEFYFLAQVIDRIKIESVILISVKQISSIERLQRRDFFRFKTILPAVFRFVTDSKLKEEWFKAFVNDISGGGIRLYTEKFIPLYSIIECKIKLDKVEDVSLRGKVLRVSKVLEAEKQYDIGISFVDISERIRDKIITFIFEEQRRLRQKEER